jgi:hypothetical protein
LLRNYPRTVCWRQNQGYWLLVESAIFDNFDRAAVFLVGISTEHRIARAWGFWGESGVTRRWIGPRHTNFPDGSICSFVPADGTWLYGDPIIELIDLYTVWAMRHLHLENFGRWPGSQDAIYPFERLAEFHEDEICSCGSQLRYGKCCRKSDLARNRISDAIVFALRSETKRRQPPAPIVSAALGLRKPPELNADLAYL